MSWLILRSHQRKKKRKSYEHVHGARSAIATLIHKCNIFANWTWTSFNAHTHAHSHTHISIEHLFKHSHDRYKIRSNFDRFQSNTECIGFDLNDRLSWQRVVFACRRRCRRWSTVTLALGTLSLAAYFYNIFSDFFYCCSVSIHNNSIGTLTL